MKYKLTCKSLGMNDSFVSTGKTKSDVMKKMLSHGKKEHRFSNKELKDPEMLKMMKEKITMS